MCLFWQVEVVNPDTSPANNIAVVVDPGQVRGFTAANGMARLTINTVANINQLAITVSKGFTIYNLDITLINIMTFMCDNY